MIAKKLGAKSTVARIRSYEYNNQINKMKRDFGITMTINPEKEAALEIMKIINFPEAIRVDTFAKGNVDLVELYIPETSPLIGQTLASIHQKYQVKVLVCAVQRNEEVFIPTGSFTFQAKDKVHITASRSSVRQFLNKLGLIESKIKNVMIIGGGKVAVYLGEALLRSKYSVKIIEKDYERCLELSQILPNATIIHGNGSDQRILNEEGINDTDAIVTLTGIDEENIIISMYAYKQNVHKIITKVNKTSLIGLVESLSMVSTISPKEITASQIVSYIRATNNSRGNNVITLYKLVNNQVEALEFKANDKSKALNISLKNLKLKKNLLIAGIIRDGEVIIPSGDSYIQTNDSVIIVTTNPYLDELDDILE
jgi:trk system potassium uptake protein TrkA